MGDAATGAGGATNGAGTGGGGGSTAGEQAVAQLRDARRRLGAAGQEIEQLKERIAELSVKAETADTLGGEVKRLKAEITGLGEQHATERSLWAAGLTDPDEVELVKFAHGRLPEKDRPTLGAFVEGLKKDPSKAPKLIENIAARWAKDAKGGDDKRGAQPKRAPIRPNRGVVDTDAEDTGTEPTQAEWDAANSAARRGDRKALDALRERKGLPARPRRR